MAHMDIKLLEIRHKVTSFLSNNIVFIFQSTFFSYFCRKQSHQPSIMAIHGIYFLLSIFLFLCTPVSGQEAVSITQFGGLPDNRKDAMTALKRALTHAKGKPNITIVFPRGRYDFFPSRLSNTAFDMTGLDGITIDGQGSDFVFHGIMRPAVIRNCNAITFKNFSIDWDRPFISQGEIRKVTSRYVDIHIDAQLYPYEIKNDKIVFQCEGVELPPSSQFNNLYDKETKEIVFDTRDAPLGNVFEQRAKLQKGDVVRFFGTPPTLPAEGTIVAIRHVRNYECAFFVQESKDLMFQNIKVFHSLSHAFLFEHSENITLDNASAVCNEQKGRVFSSVNDNAHFVSCKGKILLTNCEQSGAGDDFTNIHGRYFKIAEKKDARTVVIESRDVNVSIGEEIWPLKSGMFQKRQTVTVRSCKVLPSKGEWKRYEVELEDYLPQDISVGDLMESKTWIPDVVISNCRITRRHRARGILVSSPGKVRIENNYFACAGAAIVIEGDAKNWYESGAVEDVTITGNTFDNCFSSGNSNGNNGNWGNAIISITPSYLPSSARSRTYHHNIKISNNTFKVFDAPILYARAVDGITYEFNKIIKTQRYPQYTWQRSAFLFDGCRNVSINNNMWDRNYTYREARILHMSRNDVLSSEQLFRISETNNEGR